MNVALTPLRTLLKDAQTKHFEQGQILFYTGDPLAESVILKSGIVKVHDITSKGEEKVVQIVKAPAILPLDLLLSSPENIQWHYSALTDVEAYTFSASELYEHIINAPHLAAYIINWLAVEAHELMVRVDGMSKSDVKSKILTVLAFFEVHYSQAEKRGWKRIEFPVTHQLIADIAGTTRESATLQLGHLQKEKIIRFKRPFIEVNAKRLIACLEAE